MSFVGVRGSVGLGALLLVLALTGGACGEAFGTSDCVATRTCPFVGGQGGEGDLLTEGGSSAASSAGGEDGGVRFDVGGASGADGTLAAGAGGGANPSMFVGCDGKPFEGNAEVLRSCILRVGCRPWAFPSDTVSRCLSQNTQKSRSFQNCSLTAKSCTDLEACDGQRQENEFCAGKANGDYCSGTNLVRCFDGTGYSVDCAKDSGLCHDFPASANFPDKLVACVLPGVTGCTADDAVLRCGGAGNAYSYACRDKLAYGTKCTKVDMACSADTKRCDVPHDCSIAQVACSGSTAEVCDGTTKTRFDCASVGLRCETTGSYVGDDAKQCLAPGCTRENIASCKERCDGNRLTVCYGGSPVSVDCRDYGFTKCSEYDYSCADVGGGDCVNDVDVVSFAQCE